MGEDMIDGYRVCSNGLSLPPSHSLHLPWMTVLKLASDAARRFRFDGGGRDEAAATVGAGNNVTKVLDCVAITTTKGMTNVQLPVNVLETRGIAVA